VLKCLTEFLGRCVKKVSIFDDFWQSLVLGATVVFFWADFLCSFWGKSLFCGFIIGPICEKLSFGSGGTVRNYLFTDGGMG